MVTRHATIGLATAAFLITAAGCGNKDEGGMTDTTAMIAPSAAATDSAMMAASGGAMAGVLTDANVVYILDQANASDSARGTLAATKGTAADVKSYGNLMVGEHHALRVAGQELATRLGVAPQAPSGDQSEAQAKTEMDSLMAMPKGAAWDRAYIDFEVGYHKAVIETATKALDAPLNSELKDLIRSASPTLQHHLERAEAIQKTLAG